MVSGSQTPMVESRGPASHPDVMWGERDQPGAAAGNRRPKLISLSERLDPWLLSGPLTTPLSGRDGDLPADLTGDLTRPWV